MKGFGTDEDAIIEVLCRRTCDQRMEIVKIFKTAYGKDLIEDIKSECRNNFLGLLIALLTPKYEFYARELYEAMYGEGTDEDVLVEVMCGLSNHDIRAINAMYSRIFGKSLEDALREDTSGCFKRVMVSLSTGNRDESMITDPNAARIDAQTLKDAGISRMGTDESGNIENNLKFSDSYQLCSLHRIQSHFVFEKLRADKIDCSRIREAHGSYVGEGHQEGVQR